MIMIVDNSLCNMQTSAQKKIKLLYETKRKIKFHLKKKRNYKFHRNNSDIYSMRTALQGLMKIHKESAKIDVMGKKR